MTAYEVVTTTHFDRAAKKLHKQHRELANVLEGVINVLSTDPYNREGRHQIKKLVDVKPEEGNFRLRITRWRFRYSIYGSRVVLHDVSLRREDTY